MKNSIDKIAIFALTESGVQVAVKLAVNIKDSKLIIPEKFNDSIWVSGDVETFSSGGFSLALKQNWSLFKRHIFIMATGIVVRQIVNLLEDKTKDPAVVVCDEKGEYAISLLSGHIGGANRVAKFAASILGGKAVVTTATDVQGLTAFDELAAIQGWRVVNPENIKVLNAMLLEGKKIAVLIPELIFNDYYTNVPHLTCITSMMDIENSDFQGVVVMDSNLSDSLFVNSDLYAIPSLILSS